MQVEKKCAICGEINNYIELRSTNAFGSPDLDTRPPEMRRSTIYLWAQTCQNCGYVSHDISKKIPKSEEVIHSNIYKEQLDSSNFPKLANSFLCYSMILENIEEYTEAGWACLHAAWVCDDSGYSEAAKVSRKKAFILFMRAKEKGEKIAEQLGADEAIIVDLLRRAGEFEKALKFAEEGLKNKPEKIIETTLNFQIKLINKRDTSCYTIDDAIGDII